MGRRHLYDKPNARPGWDVALPLLITLPRTRRERSHRRQPAKLKHCCNKFGEERCLDTRHGKRSSVRRHRPGRKIGHRLTWAMCGAHSNPRMLFESFAPVQWGTGTIAPTRGNKGQTRTGHQVRTCSCPCDQQRRSAPPRPSALSSESRARRRLCLMLWERQCT